MTATAHVGLAPSRVTLDNGAVVIAKQSQTTPAVTLHAAIAGGVVFDPPDRPGVAHFVSRTIDRGTRTRTAAAIAEDLDRRGVALNVTVNRHVLSFVCTCLVEDLDAILALVADIVRHPAFPEDEVGTRRGEIVTMIRQDVDNPATTASERLLAELYGTGHGYGRRTRGSVESLEAIDRATLVRFHEARFAPATLSLVMVGDVEPSAAIEAAAAAFGDWRAPQPPLLQLDEVMPSARRRVCVVPMMNKVQADIAYGFVSIRRMDPAYHAYWLMNNILGQYSLGGRLGDRIRERQGMAYYVFSALDANVIRGPLMIRAGVSPANVDRTLAAIDEELSTLRSEGPTEAELAESKQYLIGSMPRHFETNIGIANFLQTAEFFGLGLDYDVRLPALLRAVTQDEVGDAARRVLVPDWATAVVAGPYTGQPA